MNLEHYRVFHQVVRSGNITHAAEALFITQPAVSRTVRALEEDLGCALLIRSSQGVRPTPQGERLFLHLEQVFQTLSVAEREVREVNQLLGGVLRIGVSNTLARHYLLPYLRQFNRLHPAVHVEVFCPNTPGIADLLRTGRLDVGIVNLPYLDDNLMSRPLAEIHDVFVGGPRYRKLSHEVQPISILKELPLMMLERNSRTRVLTDRFLVQQGLDVQPAFELANMDLLVDFARYDLGVACVVREFVQDALDKEILFQIKTSERIPARHIGVAWWKDVPVSPAARGFIAQLDELTLPEL